MSLSNAMNKPLQRSWKLRRQILVANLLLATLIVLTFSVSMFVISMHATYKRAEADLLAAAQELTLQLKANPTPATLEISDLYRHRFGMASRDHAYLAMWDRNGQQMLASEALPTHAIPADRLPEAGGPHPFHTRATGRFLDLVVRTPQHGQLLIGRPLAKEWDGLIGLAARLAVLSALCLAVAAILSFWLAKRLAAPIDELAEMAQRITVRDVDQRLTINNKSSVEVLQLRDSLNQLVERLRSAIERQTRFVADASHELRTPVTVILSQAEHTLHKDREVQMYKDSMHVCLQSARRMKRLIDDLLFLAKADSRKLCVVHEPVELALCAAQSIELLQPLARSHSIDVSHDLHPVRVHGDREQVLQIFINLITNAIRYNRPGGRVTVRTFARMGTAVVEVHDNGIGISSSDVSHIFERFYRADAARTHHAEAGTGLGLSLVHEIAAAHSGSISVRSELEAGTTFTVTLPEST